MIAWRVASVVIGLVVACLVEMAVAVAKVPKVAKVAVVVTLVPSPLRAPWAA